MREYKPLFYIVSLLFLINTLNAQNQIEEKYREYFKDPREVVYLQVGKDIFLPDEEIWFKGYLYDLKKSQPSDISKTINVGVYDSLGVLKKELLYYVNEGFFKGSVKVDSTFGEGRYFLKAKTNWMRNFKDDNAFLKQILVVKSDYNIPLNQLDPRKVDIQFLPEGGKLVAGINNIVGVKVQNGMGMPLQMDNIKIVDEAGKQLALIETNSLGLGKFEITPELNVFYFANLQMPSGEELSVRVPRIYAKGINLNVVDNPYKNEVFVQVEANDLALKDGEVKTNLLLHKYGEFISEPVVLSKNARVHTAYFDKTNLMEGVNILTLLDDRNNPIEERQFYVWNSGLANRVEASINYATVTKDSLEITLNSRGYQPMGISVSVLPENTKVYKGENSIYKQIYLMPYIQGDVENASYYFSKNEIKKKYDLDLLLLTQGYSKYDWQEILSDKLETKYDSVDGLTLYGFLNEELKRESILVHKSIEHEPSEINLSPGQDKFLITNFYPINGENIFFSKKNNWGKLSKLNMYARLSNSYFLDEKIDVSGIKKINFFNTESGIMDSRSNDLALPDLHSDFELIALDNVTVTEQSKLEKQARENIRVPRYLASKITVVDEELALTYGTVAELLRSKGYVVLEELQAYDGGDPAFISRYKIRSRRNPRFGVNIVLDDVVQMNLDVLYQMPLTQVESFYIDRLSRYMGTKAGNTETIYIFTRQGEELNLTPGKGFMSDKSFAFKVDNGFERQKEFYNPEFISFTNTAFENFGLIHWEPLVWLDKNNNYTLKIPNYGFDNLKVIIEGMGKDGSLFSEVKILNTAKSN
ncbi:hypothetical protein GUA46_10835 [Muricauda sp. HICW]|uniref:Uncharacterized protein n=1 Tax=Flagellimonas chongwuensis TaxID=2697365 RepID=A0A850NKJ8_9FLAO|nr:hypothetical protein [Allomuricauda chongwuensis]NVN18838.1 hypothetical protein [Allomuricauda chongwuensis]